MKIGIIGTRGIPNNYGGFEQFTEYIAPMLALNNHDVTVYCSSTHPYKGSSWKGVQLVHINDPEDKVGTIGQFAYDLNCILHTRKMNFDIILQLGYTSSSIWNWLFPKGATIVTNMDGLEWKRSKYSRPVQLFLKYAERLAVKNSNILIADSIGIQSYLKTKYSKPSTYISYGADIFSNPNANMLEPLALTPYQYNIMIARIEPENNIETILSSYAATAPGIPLLVIGDHQKNIFSKRMFSTYSSESIKFMGAIYDMEKLNNLRHYSNLYFHGHSVGGTNPSLLEAMASQSLIIANENIFNQSILGEDAYYFSNEKSLNTILEKNILKKEQGLKIENNTKKILESHSWEYIHQQMEELFKQAV